MLNAITAGARDLLGVDVVVLRMVDTEDSRHTLLVSAQGLPDLQFSRSRRLQMDVGLAGRAMLEGRLISVTDYRDFAGPSVGAAGHAAMAVPVREDDHVVGALIVASTASDRRYGIRDQETLSAFADHVSLALTDAHGLAAVEQARRGSLTGLPSRGLFLDWLAHELADAALLERPPSILFIDLDRFKQVNDSLGHRAGDELLVIVSTRIRTALRAADVIGRLGGDEFVVLLPGTDTSTGSRIAERVLEAFREPVLLGGRLVATGASIGLATTSARDQVACDRSAEWAQQQAGDLLGDADSAMYRAKGRDGSCYEIFAPTMSGPRCRRRNGRRYERGSVTATGLGGSAGRGVMRCARRPR